MQLEYCRLPIMCVINRQYHEFLKEKAELCPEGVWVILFQKGKALNKTDDIMFIINAQSLFNFPLNYILHMRDSSR